MVKSPPVYAVAPSLGMEAVVLYGRGLMLVQYEGEPTLDLDAPQVIETLEILSVPDVKRCIETLEVGQEISPGIP